MTLGDGLGIIAMLVWLSVSVGPWWMGLAVCALAFVGNIVQQMYLRRRT